MLHKKIVFTTVTIITLLGLSAFVSDDIRSALAAEGKPILELLASDIVPTPDPVVIDDLAGPPDMVAQAQQAQVGAASPQIAISSTLPQNVPSLAEREAMLDHVNLAPQRPATGWESSTPPEPGTESVTDESH